MQAYGNDYIYISLIDQQLNDIDIPKFAAFVSDRHKGIGSDGLILVCISETADFKMRVFNPDGSEAEMCGNGLRSVGKFVYEKKYTEKKSFTVETLGGIKTVNLFVENGKVENISANIGKPVLESGKIPVTLTNKGNALVGYPYKIDDKTFSLTALSLGNPHCGAETDSDLGLDDPGIFDIEKYGALLENAAFFPKKANIHFFSVVDKSHINMRSWERNCGETLACATGCATVFYSAYLVGKVGETVFVKQRGGVIKIDYNRKNDEITMTGKSETVFEGVIDKSAFDDYYA